MKKIIGILAFLLAFTVIFSSCTHGGNSSPSDSSGTTPPPDDKYAELLDGYEKSDSVTEFSTDNLDKVSLKETFDAAGVTADGKDVLIPFGMFGSGMCLQRDAVNRVWGTFNGNGNTHIAAEFRGKTYFGTVSGNNWEIYFPTMTAGGPYEMSLICDAGRIDFTDVYVGEVYLLSGQSNMEWKTVSSGTVLSGLYSNAETCVNERIRMVYLDGNFQDEPTKEFRSAPVWNGANASSIKEFSAVGYIFGRDLQKKLGCPVGLICNAIGGTIIESWMDKATTDEYEKNNVTEYDESQTRLMPNKSFNGMIYPLEGLNFRGVCWYQGESNTYGSEVNYDVALKTLISLWRKFFNNPQLTFTVAELARFCEHPAVYSVINEKIAKVVEEDALVCKAINIDQGDWTNIHPKDKRAIGARLASETARNFFNREENVAPVVTSYEIVSDKEVWLIMSENVVAKNGANGFEVLTEDGYSFNCSVMASENIVVVSSDTPFSGIRYGYAFEEKTEITSNVSKSVTLFDKDGLSCDLFILNFKK